jgi:hypothetical protein
MKRILWRLFTVIVVLVMAVLMIRTFAQVRKNPSDQDEEEEEQEEAIKAPSRVSVQNGQTVATLDPESQAHMGIAVAPLKAIISRSEITAPAVVLSAQELVTARNNYVTAQTALEKAEASVQVMQQEADRLKALYADNQNASQKALQSTEGSLRSGRADVEAARQNLALQETGLHQSWGDVVGKWVVDDPPPLDRVFTQRDFLVQVTVPAGAVSRAPETISLELPGSGHAQARLISPFPRVDPRIQGASFLYTIQNHLPLAPGLNLMARLPAGQSMRGVLVPEQAIVRWHGSAWVYIEASSGHFIRREIPTDTLLPGGILVSGGLSPGDQIVTTGAQTLLSEEFRSQIQPED